MDKIIQHNFKTIKPQSIFVTDVVDPVMNEDIVKVIRKSGDKQDYKTNVKAYMTDWDISNKPGFKQLTKHIISITKYLSEKYYHRKDTKLRIDNMWGMIYKRDEYAMVHDHWPSIWSGVYYINVPDNGGSDLYFPQLKTSLSPKENQMVIFDGYLRHGVKPNKSDKERIAVSFNVKEAFQNRS